MSEEQKKFRYVKPYTTTQIVDDNGNVSKPKLDTPKFRDSFKEAEVQWQRRKFNGFVAEVKFQENYNKDGDDMKILVVSSDSYLLLTLSCQSVMGKQVMKRITNVDLARPLVFDIWNNPKGYANISLYQRDENDVDENGVGKKVFVKDAFKDDADLPEVTVVKVGKKEERDHLAQVEYIKSHVLDWAKDNDGLSNNLEMVNTTGADDGNDDC